MTMRKLKNVGWFAVLSLSLTSSWAETIVHKIEKGDQLLKISSKYYGTVKMSHKILKANPKINPDYLIIGETLIIPSQDQERVQSIYQEDWKAKYENIITETELKDKEAQYWKAKYLKAFSQQDSQLKVLQDEKVVLEKENDNLESLIEIARIHHEKKEAALLKKISNLESQSEASQKDLLRSQEKLQALSTRYDELNNWKQERQELLSKMNELHDLNKKLTNENESLSAKGEVFVRQNLANSEEFIMKEKGRILSERLWVEKNKSVSECKIQLSSRSKGPAKAEDLLSLLSSQFGAKNFFLDPSENKVIIRLPGESIIGVDSPRLRQKYQVALSKLSGFLKDFAVTSAKIETYDSYKGKILDEDSEEVDKDLVYLKQSKTILDYLAKKMLIPQSEMAIGKGSLMIATKKNAKYFDLSLSFEKGTLNLSDTIPSASSDLSAILAQSKIKIDSAESKDGILEFDFPRDQFFGKSDQVLSSGKAKLEQIVSLFSNTPDVGVEVLWAPGQFDRNEELNISNALKDLSKLKNSLGASERVSFYKVSGRDAFRKNLNPSPDKLQKRIIFRVVPYSLGIRFATL